VTAFCEGADLTVVVVTPEPTSMADAYAMVKCLSLSTRAGLPVLVVNQATSRQEAEAVAERIAGVAGRFLGSRPALLAWIPLDPAAPRCVRRRIPLLLGEPKAAGAEAIGWAAAALANRLGLSKAGPANKPRLTRALAGILGLASGAAFAGGGPRTG
jgi:flagellar biosynthesis protein FlhG